MPTATATRRAVLIGLGAAWIATARTAQADGDRYTPPPLDAALLSELSGLPRLTDVQFGDVRGRPVIAVFFATWSAPCRPQFEVLNRIAGAFRDTDLAIVAVNVFEDRGDRSSAGSRRRFYGVTAPVFPVLDGNAAAPDTFGGVVHMPTAVIYDRGGRPVESFVREENAGRQYLGYAAVKDAIAALL